MFNYLSTFVIKYLIYVNNYLKINTLSCLKINDLVHLYDNLIVLLHLLFYY